MWESKRPGAGPGASISGYGALTGLMPIRSGPPKAPSQYRPRVGGCWLTPLGRGVENRIPQILDRAGVHCQTRYHQHFVSAPAEGPRRAHAARFLRADTHVKGRLSETRRQSVPACGLGVGLSIGGRGGEPPVEHTKSGVEITTNRGTCRVGEDETNSVAGRGTRWELSRPRMNESGTDEQSGMQEVNGITIDVSHQLKSPIGAGFLRLADAVQITSHTRLSLLITSH